MFLAESRRRQSIQPMIQEALREFTQNQLTTQADSPGIDSDRHMTRNASPLFDSIQLLTQAKNI